MCLYIYVFLHAITINEKEGVSLEESEEQCMWRSGGMEEEGRL